MGISMSTCHSQPFALFEPIEYNLEGIFKYRRKDNKHRQKLYAGYFKG